MDLGFGTNVREQGHGIGRMAGIEVERRTHVVRNIVISRTGQVGAQIERRPLAAVPMDHFDGVIVLHFGEPENPVAPHETVVLSHATRVMREGRCIGRLSGVEVAPETGELVAIVGRQHWWTRRFRLPAEGFDFSVAGEIRATTASTQAA
jgi:hypothetical protein